MRTSKKDRRKSAPMRYWTARNHRLAAKTIARPFHATMLYPIHLVLSLRLQSKGSRTRTLLCTLVGVSILGLDHAKDVQLAREGGKQAEASELVGFSVAMESVVDLVAAVVHELGRVAVP